MTHPHAVRTVALCAVTAAAELALLAGVTPDVTGLFPGGLILIGFIVGAPAFLALMAWRRRAHAGRTRLLFAVAVVVAVAGLGVLGLDFFRYRTDPQFRLTPGRNPLLLPLVQWLIALAAWLPMAVVEGREKNAPKSP